MTDQPSDYHAGKMKVFGQLIARMVQRDPTLADDPDRLWATVVANVPALANRKECPNCSASMMEYIFEFDLHDALLLLAMAKRVNERMENMGFEFTTANKVHVQTLHTSSYATRSRTTQASKLGLIAKHHDPGKKTQTPGTWVITSRGWAALAGKPVPRKVRVWRGQILERTEETITIQQALASHEAKIKDLAARKKTIKHDYREDFREYDPADFVHFAGYHEGTLL